MVIRFHSYAEKGDKELVIKWANKADSIVHNKDSILTQISEGTGLFENYKFIEYWPFRNMFYAACCIYSDKSGMISCEDKHKIIDMVIGFGELFLKENTSDNDTFMLCGTKDEIQSLLNTLINIWND